MFFSTLVISALKTTVLKWEMLLEFVSCVSVTFIQKTYENDSFCEITQCRQSLCHVCLQCIEGKHWAKMQYYRNCVLKKDMRNKPSKAPISNHIYCTMTCDLQLLSTKLHFFFVSWVRHLNMIFVPQCDSCSVAKKTWEMPKKWPRTGATGMLKIDWAITRISIYRQSFSA